MLGFFQSSRIVISNYSGSQMAGETGLEPAAFAVTGRRYNQLNYSPAMLQCEANIVNLGNYRQGNSPFLRKRFPERHGSSG